jgi:chromosome segregation ATPase
MDLWPIVLPIVVSVILSVSGALAISRYSGPAQKSYIDALEGRLRLVSAERDEATARIPRLEERVRDLEQEVGDLKRENIDLYRRLGAPHAPRGQS